MQIHSLSGSVLFVWGHYFTYPEATPNAPKSPGAASLMARATSSGTAIASRVRVSGFYLLKVVPVKCMQTHSESLAKRLLGFGTQPAKECVISTPPHMNSTTCYCVNLCLDSTLDPKFYIRPTVTAGHALKARPGSAPDACKGLGG